MKGKRLIAICGAVLGAFALAVPSYALDQTSEQPVAIPGVVTKLEPTTPEPTNADRVKAGSAALSWTATGVGNTQDTYDIIVSSIAPPDDEPLALDTALVHENDLVDTYKDVSQLTDGQYYWQLRPCSAAGVCRDWSPVYSVYVDGVAPEAPTVSQTSSAFDQRVTVGGTAESASRVTAIVDDQSCSATADEIDGAWSCQLDEQLAYGKYSAAVVAADSVGNQSQAAALQVVVKELFVAPVISADALPTTLDIVSIPPAVVTPEPRYQMKVIDSVNMARIQATEPEQEVLGVAAPGSLEGGVVQASEQGWQVLGFPWYGWVVVGAVIFVGRMALSGRSSRQAA